MSRDSAVLATDFRYTEQAGNQSPDFRVVRIGSDWSWLLEILREHGIKKIGFESHQMTVATYRQVRATLQDLPSEDRPTLMETTGMVESLRTVKDRDELTLLQKAIDVADAAMQAVSPTIQPGETEQEVAWRLERTMRELGADFPQLRHHRGRRSQRRHASSQALGQGHSSGRAYRYRHGGQGGWLL